MVQSTPIAMEGLPVSRSRIDMSIGGWDGWYFGRYGRAKQWRIHAPTGECFIPTEILNIRATLLDLDYLRLRIRRLEAQKGLTLSPDDVSVIHALQRLVERLSVFPTDSRQDVSGGVLPGLPGQLLDFKKALAG